MPIKAGDVIRAKQEPWATAGNYLGDLRDIPLLVKVAANGLISAVRMDGEDMPETVKCILYHRPGGKSRRKRALFLPGYFEVDQFLTAARKAAKGRKK